MGRITNFKYCLVYISLLLLNIYDAEAANRPKFPEDMHEIILHIHNTCVGLTGVVEADISQCENGVFAKDKKLGCYMFCLMEEASFVDENGNVDYDMLISMIPEEWRKNVSSMINACRHLDVPGKDTCEKALEVHQCLYQTDSDSYFLF